MNIKRAFFAVLIALFLLFLQFKIIPFFIKRRFFLKREILSPVQIEEKFKFELLSSLKEEGFLIISGPFQKDVPKGIEFEVLFSNKKVRIIFSERGNANSQLTSLQLVLKEAKMRENKIPVLVDLTGDKVYVAF